MNDCTLHHGNYMSWLEDATGFRIHYILGGSQESRAQDLKSWARRMRYTILTVSNSDDEL